jgi:hypothetical protein
MTNKKDKDTSKRDDGSFFNPKDTKTDKIHKKYVAPEESLRVDKLIDEVKKRFEKRS